MDDAQPGDVWVLRNNPALEVTLKRVRLDNPIGVVVYVFAGADTEFRRTIPAFTRLFRPKEVRDDPTSDRPEHRAGDPGDQDQTPT